VCPSPGGVATDFNGVSDVAADRVHNELAVSNCNPGSVLVFALTANGNVAPSRKISGAATGLTCASDVAVDTTNDDILVSDEINDTISTFAANSSCSPCLRSAKLPGASSKMPQFSVQVTEGTSRVGPRYGSRVAATLRSRALRVSSHGLKLIPSPKTTRRRPQARIMMRCPTRFALHRENDFPA
jgi:hypothetical protein